MQYNTPPPNSCKTDFRNNSKKVKYIADHFITLQNILDQDEPLSNMLIDMINRAMYGMNAPTLYTQSSYTPFRPLKDNISLPPPPNIIEGSSEDEKSDNEKNDNLKDFQRLPAENFLKMNNTIEYTDTIVDNDNPRAVIFCNIA